MMASTRWLALLAAALAFAACGGLGETGAGADGKVTLSWLVDNSEQTLKPAEALAAAFSAKHPDIAIQLETRPQGADGDNVVKTRLATGEMTDLFLYNSGSLFQALSPERNLVPLSDQPWVGRLEDAFKPAVSANGQLYGAPFGGSIGGGVLYNERVYERLGLQVPKTWHAFMANNARLKAEGIDPVIQTYQDTWTSQLLLLANHHNVAAKDPGWAEKYTANRAKFADQPGLAGFERLEAVHAAGYENQDFASARFEDGLRALAAGKGAHYPMLTLAVGAIANASPHEIGDIGFFALPGDDAAANGLTLWLPAGVYIPRTTEGAKLAAAKQFVAFVAGKEGCDVQTQAFTPSGPYMTKGCALPANVPPAIQDLQPYVDGGNVTPALEFLSPVKGPALEHITVEVGSGLRSARSGAELYDRDVEKQAQQLGLDGW
jgi:raffinose/stachyose/melibiose transport system substrate-binding protein